MKVKELIELLEQENPEAEVYTHPFVHSPDLYKLGTVGNGYINNDDWMVTHSEWAYANEMHSGNRLTIPIVILEEE